MLVWFKNICYICNHECIKKMFDKFFNDLFLKFWAGKKKVGPNKKVLLSKSFVVYGDTVVDLTWSLRYIHSNGKTSHPVAITERTNRWSTQEVIERIEETRIPKAIDMLISKHTEQKDQ